MAWNMHLKKISNGFTEKEQLGDLKHNCLLILHMTIRDVNSSSKYGKN